METPPLSTPSLLGREKGSQRKTSLRTGPPPSIQGLVGTLVHHFFEVLLSETGTPSLQWREALNREAHSRSIEDGEAAGEQAVALVESFLSSPLLDHWRHISIAGREVPMVMRYGGPSPCVLTGSIDLLYRGEDNRWVVADYKTDRVPEGGMSAMARTYRRQGSAYAQAVQEALNLSYLPRFELWLIRLGQTLEVPPRNRGSLEEATRPLRPLNALLLSFEKTVQGCMPGAYPPGHTRNPRSQGHHRNPGTLDWRK